MNKITPQVRQSVDAFTKALETYYEFFGELPDLANKEDRAELHSIYMDMRYIQDNIRDRQNRKVGA